MIKIKTATLTRKALDWAVATLEGYRLTTDGISMLVERGDELRLLGPNRSPLSYSPSTNWSQGGPIVDRLLLDGMLLETVDPVYRKDMPAFKATLTRWVTLSRADTALEAAMRCYVESKLGSEVDVPEELL